MCRLESVLRRNFKKVSRPQLEAALLKVDSGQIYGVHDVDKALKLLIKGIMAALYEVAPLREIKIKRGKAIYLAKDTLT